MIAARRDVQSSMAVERTGIGIGTGNQQCLDRLHLRMAKSLQHWGHPATPDSWLFKITRRICVSNF